MKSLKIDAKPLCTSLPQLVIVTTAPSNCFASKKCELVETEFGQKKRRIETGAQHETTIRHIGGRL
jgi:hypothetical protein